MKLGLDRLGEIRERADLLEGAALGAVQLLHVVFFLMPQERERRAVERAAEADGRFRGNRAAAVADAVEERRVDAGELGEAILRDAKLLERLLEHRPGMADFEFSGHGFFSMIVRDSDVEGVPAGETEDDPPLSIDPYRPKPAEVSGKLFKAVRRREAQIKNIFRTVDGPQLLEGGFLDSARELPRFFAAENPRRLLAGKASYHAAQSPR